MLNKDWLDIGQKIVPWIALLVASVSAWLSLQSFRLTQQQAKERKASIDFGLNDLWFTKNDDGQRIYALDITIANRASVANSLVRLELITSYSLLSGHEVRLRTPLHRDKDADLPLRLDSFQAVTKTFKFSILPDTIPDNARIESYLFEFTDNSGQTHEISPTLIIEQRSLNVTEKNQKD